MFSNNRWNTWLATAVSKVAVIVFCLVMFIPIAQAETPFDITDCGSGTITMVPDGNIIVGEITRVETEESTWKFLQGTGKWKGITGGGKGRTIAGGKPITVGTFQACFRHTGTFELPNRH